MIEYTYFCQKCKLRFAVFKNRSEYQEREKCPDCRSKKNVNRDFLTDLPTGCVKLHISEIKKLGHYASRKSEKMSEDEKDHLWLKHNAYKAPNVEKELPRGMSRVRKELTPPVKHRFVENERRKLNRKSGKNG